jgi:predicted ArsR family transcriptional regulator
MIDLPVVGGEDDALTQPTRARLFSLLSELRRPAGTAELAERLELHPNGIRLHLERLERAGLLQRVRVRQPRGRPSDTWTIARDAKPGGQAPHAYRDLGRWLARALRTPAGGLRGIESTGRQIGRELATGQDANPHALETSLSALGFSPAVARRGSDQLSICLRNCPYRDAVVENPRAICTLHRGITRGLVDVLHPRAKLTAFVPRDPDEAGCLIELAGVANGR